MRGVVLGNDEKLVDAKNVATFGSTKISQSNWNRLADKNYFVSINVGSARKVWKYDLLDCGFQNNRISTFAGKATEAPCRMIGEP